VRDYSASALPFIDSTNLSERRFYRVWLPRGYSQHTTKRYPVLYMHDGQNCFEPGPFGTWNADTAAAQQIARGALRELIIVAADSNNNRFTNYVPSGDITPAGNAGNAAAYLRFMRDELKPRIDSQYRTLPDAANTGTMGSSMGGQVSMVFGWDAPTTYTRIGALSNYWSTNFRNRVTSTAKPNIRLYMDSGDSGTASDNFTPTFNVRDALLNNSRVGGPFVSELNFRHTIGFSQQHNEGAGAQRVGPAMSFLFPATEEPNALIAFADGAQFDLTSDARISTEDAYRQSLDAARDVNISGEINAEDARVIANASRTSERANLLTR
jgi:predicted alpha/beta superfamily hydrolase